MSILFVIAQTDSSSAVIAAWIAAGAAFTAAIIGSVSSYLIPDAEALDPEWLSGAMTVGVTAGASAPEELVFGLVERLGDIFDVSVRNLEAIEENVQFKLPKELAMVD